MSEFYPEELPPAEPLNPAVFTFARTVLGAALGYGIARITHSGVEWEVTQASLGAVTGRSWHAILAVLAHEPGPTENL